MRCFRASRKLVVKFMLCAYLVFINKCTNFLAWPLQFLNILGSFPGPGFLCGVIHRNIFFAILCSALIKKMAISTYFITIIYIFVSLNVDYSRICYCSMNLHHGYSRWWALNMKTYMDVLCIPGISSFHWVTSFSLVRCSCHAWKSLQYIVL